MKTPFNPTQTMVNALIQQRDNALNSQVDQMVLAASTQHEVEGLKVEITTLKAQLHTANLALSEAMGKGQVEKLPDEE